MQLIDRALRRLYLLCGVLAAVAIVLIAVLVLVNIVARLFGVYVGGMTEGAGYAMAAAGSLGLAYTFGSGGHVRVDLVLSRFPAPSRRWLDVTAFVLTTIAVCYLARFLVRMVAVSWDFGDISDGSDELPLWIPQLPAAFGFCVFALSLGHSTIVYLVTGHTHVRSEDALLVEPED